MPGKRLDEMVEESNDTGAWYPGKLVHDAVEDMENGTYVPGAEIHKMVTKSEENGSWFPGGCALHATALPTSAMLTRCLSSMTLCASACRCGCASVEQIERFRCRSRRV